MYAYKNELIALYSLWEFARALLGRLQEEKTQTRQQREALLFFRQSVEDVGALLAILPHSPIGSGYKTFSVTLVSSVGRNLLDSFLSISYLMHCFPPEESSLVELVQDQFVDQTRAGLVQTFNPSSEAVAGLKTAIAERRMKIEAHSEFPSLPKDLQNNVKNGFTDKIVPKDTILGYMQIVPSIFWTSNNHFSQHIHSTAYSADQLGVLGIDPIDDERFARTLIRDIQGMCSLVILITLYGFEQPIDVVPLNILSILLFWQDYFRDTQKEKYGL